MYALDAAGQVYLFGSGPTNAFSGACRRDGFRGWNKVKRLWNARLHPDVAAQASMEDALHTTAQALGDAGNFLDTTKGKGKGKGTAEAEPPPLPLSHKTRLSGKGRLRALNQAESMRMRLASTQAQNSAQKHVAREWKEDGGWRVEVGGCRGRERRLCAIHHTTYTDHAPGAAVVSAERALYREDIRGNEAYTNPAAHVIMLTPGRRLLRSFDSDGGSVASSATWRPNDRAGAASDDGASSRADSPQYSDDSGSGTDSGADSGTDSDSDSVGDSSDGSGGTPPPSAHTAVSRKSKPPSEPEQLPAGSVATVEGVPSFGRDVPRSRSGLAELQVSDSTMSLWGKRVIKVALTGSVALALTDTGRLYSWGGHNNMWTSVAAPREGQPPSAVQLDEPDGLTARSKLLIGAAQSGAKLPEGEESSLYEWGDNKGVFLQTFDGIPAPPRPQLLDDSDSSNTTSDSDDSADNGAGLDTSRRRKALRSVAGRGPAVVVAFVAVLELCWLRFACHSPHAPHNVVGCCAAVCHCWCPPGTGHVCAAPKTRRAPPAVEPAREPAREPVREPAAPWCPPGPRCLVAAPCQRWRRATCRHRPKAACPAAPWRPAPPAAASSGGSAPS